MCHAESQCNTSASQKGNGHFLEWVDKTDIGTSAHSNMTEITKRLPHFSFKYKGSIKITQSHFFFSCKEEGNGRVSENEVAVGDHPRK